MTTNKRSLSPIYSIDDFRPPDGEYNEQTLRLFLEKMEPTEDDIKRQLTNDELKEICTKYKCRVDAYRWNPVYDYKKFLLRKGTLDRRSTQHELRHLAKAVNRHKKSIMYDEEVIRKTREREWRIQKKDNIMSLDLWAYQRERENYDKPKDLNQTLDGNELDVVSEHEVVTEDQHQQESAEYQVLLSEVPLMPENVIQNHVLFPSQFSDDESDEESEDADSSPVQNKNTEESVRLEVVHSDMDTEELQAEGLNKEVCRIFNVNTESMTLYDSDELAPSLLSQGQQSDPPSQGLFPKEYEDFGVEVPLTSTQSQK